MAKRKKRVTTKRRGPIAKSTVPHRRRSLICRICKAHKDTRLGVCFGCATKAEEKRRKRSRIAKVGASRRRAKPGALAKKNAGGRAVKRAGQPRQIRRASTSRKKQRIKLKWRKPRKRNSAQSAKAMFEKFHGKPSTKSIDYRTAQHQHAHLAKLGDLNYLKVLMPDEFEVEAVELRPKGVVAACSEDGGQIYFLGGDQALNLTKLGLADQLPKDHVVIGPVFEIEYTTEKKFDDFKTLDYYHEFGEEGGELPTLCYDVRSKLMYLAGGSYQCLAPGITD